MAAAYLNWTKKNMATQNSELKGDLPLTINGVAWYQYVDPAIRPEQLEEASNTLEGELTFLMQLFEAKQGQEDDDRQTGALEEQDALDVYPTESAIGNQ